MAARKPGRPNKNQYSTKEDSIPHDDQMRKDMIAQFIAENSKNDEVYQVYEAVPYEASHMIRSTGGKKKKSH